MTLQQLTAGMGGIAGMLILILDSKTALLGAAEGLELCIQTIIPALFPFFIFSILLTGAFVGSPMPLLRPLGRLFHIPKGAESMLIASFLGGYPVGAQSVAVAWKNGQLEKGTAERMLSFCSNAGPSFLFGIVSQMFPQKTTPWILWIIHIASAWLVAQTFPCRECAAKSRQATVSIGQAMTAAVKTMAAVCGWVILFRIILAFANHWFLWVFPDTAQVAIAGILELSNGCCSLSRIEDTDLRFLVCSGILALGGFCVTLQTQSVTQGLSMGYYYRGKLLQCVFSLLLCAAFLYRLWFLPVLLLLFFAVLSGKNKNTGSNPEKAVV